MKKIMSSTPNKEVMIILSLLMFVAVIDTHFPNCLLVPIGVPRNFQVKGLTRTSAQISWDPPSVEERRGFIVNYTVIVTYSKNGETKNRSYVTSERLVNVTGEPQARSDHQVMSYSIMTSGYFSYQDFLILLV